jgi:hypothetical protein
MNRKSTPAFSRLTLAIAALGIVALGGVFAASPVYAL